MGKQIALLTDFGNKDGYHAVMKGVIKSITPDASIIDLTHEISPQNVDEAAFVIWNVCKYFPRNTIFVCVVDPGVGSERRILLVKTKDYIFIAPDNGLLKYVFSEFKIQKVFGIQNTKYFLEDLSRTFHGRDVFAPVAAHILKGIPLKNFGNIIKPDTKPERFISLSEIRSKIIEGKVIYIDRFGNLITNFIFKYGEKLDMVKFVEIGGKKIFHFYNYYAQAIRSELFGLIGSRNLLELSIRNKNAAKVLKAEIGTPVKLHKK